jgi:hypothetical protein
VITLIDREVVDRLILRHIKYESWIQQENALPIHEDDIPPAYQTIFMQSEEAYSFYRHSLIYFMKDITDEGEIHQELYKLINQMINSEPENYERFKLLQDSLFNNFNNRWNNVFQFTRLFTDLRIERVELNQITLSAYQSKYEIDEILILLAVLRKVISDSILDTELNNLRDRSGRLRKGVAVDYIISGLQSFPKLAEAISKAYLPKLRNSFGHNDYKIIEGNLYSLNNELIASNKEFIEAFYNIQEVQNTVLWAISYYNCIENLENILDCGVLSIGYHHDKEQQVPEIQLCQLWCFFQYDTSRDWLNKVVVSKSRNTIKTEFTENYSISGDIIPVIGSWLEKAKQYCEVQVTIIPIIPFVGLDSITVAINGELYQMYGDPCITKIPIEINDI